jgi:hypothetical protein
MEHLVHLAEYLHHVMQLLDRAQLDSVTDPIVEVIEPSCLSEHLHHLLILQRPPIVFE